MKKFLLTCILSLLLLFSLSAEDVIRFGVFPVYNAKGIIEIFAPIADRLSEDLGLPVELVSAPASGIYRERLLNESYDIAWVNNAFYILAADSGSYRAVASGYPGFHGVVMVSADSGITGIEELEGCRVAVIGEHSVAGYLFFRELMADKGLYPGRDYEVSYIQKLEPIPFLVSNGKYSACVFSEDSYYKSKIYEKIRDQLRIIATSIEIPQFPFILHKDVNERVEKKVMDILTSISSATPEGQKIIESLNVKGFKKITDEDYSDFRILYEEIKSFSIPAGRTNEE